MRSIDQQQFLEVIDRDVAEDRFLAAIRLDPVGKETVSLDQALGRVLAQDVMAPVDVPSYDRSNFDGFAVRAADTFGAQEESPRPLRLLDEVIAASVVPSCEVQSGTAAAISTGGMLPRGADAVVMVEHTEPEPDANRLLIRRAVTPGFGVAFAGTDIAAGETVLRHGQALTSRETGVLAAVGAAAVSVWRRPRVGVISTGDEIIEPGQPMQPGKVYDSNARIIADAVRELGGDPVVFPIVRDRIESLRRHLAEALDSCDMVLLSGGTSKGGGDLSYRAVSELSDPGIVAHGVALKPGKPICLAASAGKAVVILPGFPTSAIFTFHEFVGPVITRLAGQSPTDQPTLAARLAVKVNSEIGRTEYLLVGLLSGGAGDPSLVAYPMGKGSGSVTTFSRADGFITIGRHEEIVATGTLVSVQLLGRDLKVADMVVIGSHCMGLDYLLGQVEASGWRTKFLAVGSTAGLAAAKRGECDLAGIHLLDVESGRYNEPFVTEDLELVAGYGRMQGVVFRPDDLRFKGREGADLIAQVRDDPGCLMVNRNHGSGTRLLIDQLLSGVQPNGYAVQASNHNAVAAAIAHRRADWGVAIRSAAEQAQLSFAPLAQERFDFVVPKVHANKQAVQCFRQLLTKVTVMERLAEMGFELRGQ